MAVLLVLGAMLEMFKKDAQKCIGAAAQERAFQLWQYWAQLNIDQLDENEGAHSIVKFGGSCSRQVGLLALEGE